MKHLSRCKKSKFTKCFLVSQILIDQLKDFNLRIPDYKILNLMDELTLKGVSQYNAFIDESQKVRQVVLVDDLVDGLARR